MVNFRYGSHLYWHIDYKDAILRILLLHTGHSALTPNIKTSAPQYLCV